MESSRILNSTRLILRSAIERLVPYVYGSQRTQLQPTEVSLGRKQQDHRDEIVARLRGQTIDVPDLQYIYAEWDVRLNPAVGSFREYLEDWFLKYVSTPVQRNKQRKVDNALCAGHFWTQVPADQFFVLGSLMAFMFFWDDEIDCGTLTNDRDRTEAYCDDTIAFIQHCLQPELNTAPPAAGRLHNAGAFVEIGKAVQEGQSKEARDRFAESLYTFINFVRTSQAQWLVGVSTLDDYIERRVKTVGTEPCIKAMQWGYKLSLPPSIWDHEATQAMIREVAVSVFLYNDIASLKKEVADGDVDSAIPILVWTEGIEAQVAVDRVVGMIEESWKKLLDAEQRLKCITEAQQYKHDVEVLVGGCKDIVVGHKDYTLRTIRYMAGATLDKTGGRFRTVL